MVVLRYNVIKVICNCKKTVMEKYEVLLQDHSDKGVIILNRSHSLNALTLSMTVKLLKTLKKWELEKSLVLIKAQGKAFCVGGDIRHVCEYRQKGKMSSSYEVQHQQLLLAYLTRNYKIPIVAVTNGVIMGSGAAISIHCRYCIATENTSFAMPEVGIGFIPDVGSSYIFPRLPGHLGWYLALTGKRLNCSDMHKVGLATHYCKSENVSKIEEALLNPFTNIEDVLNSFCIKDLPELSLSSLMSKINHCFSANTVEEILMRLNGDSSDWAKDTLKIMKKNCPSSLKITFRELNRGKHMNFVDCLKMEYQLACNVLEKEDFYEGVRALILEKDYNPKWNPASLEEISDEDIEKHFKCMPEAGMFTYKL